ncbi:MAG: phosphatase PAP2 family protein [bacterium]|nr:phosphatase PAP2 family protein [bacterium]
MKSKFVFFLLFVFSCSAFAVEVNDVNALTPATGIFKQDAKVYLKVSFDDAKKTYFNGDNLILLLMAGGGSIALHDKADDKIAGHFDRHRSIPRDLDNFTDIAGNPGTHFAATGIWYLMAANKKDNVNVQRSWVMMRALGVTNATTLLLKGIVNNHTPNGKSWAWPSGHTASSFTVAAVLDEFYGHKIGIPAYLAAGFVGYRMMDSGDHWASDVLFGSVLGYVVGHAIAGENKELELAGFSIRPLITTLHESPAAGIALAKEF